MPVRQLLGRARDQVDTAMAEVSDKQLSAQAREEIAVEAAVLMGKLEALLSRLRWNDNNALGRR
jgi:hypothetical protein